MTSQLRTLALRRHFIRPLVSPPSAGRRCFTKGSPPRSQGQYLSPIAGQPAHAPKSRVLQTVPLKSLVRNLLVLSIAALPSPILSIVIAASKRHARLLSSNKLLSWPLRSTFYRTFCIGEEKGEITANLEELRALGMSGIVLAFAREATKFNHDSGSEALQAANPQMREWVAMNLQTIDNLAEGDYLALRFSGAGDAVVQTLENYALLHEGQKPLGVFSAAVDEICQAAKRKNVKILVDAESSRHQAAIDHVALCAMETYNAGPEALIYNTYQMYLKSNLIKLQRHVALSRDKNFTIGVKLVRGAYMHAEAEPDRLIFHDTKSETDESYDSAVGFLLGSRNETMPAPDGARGWNAEVMLATHNAASVDKAVDLWQAGKASPEVPHVNGGRVQRLVFAQLMGMADEVSLKLAADIQRATSADGSSKLPRVGVYKYTIWGSFADCFLYMIRRAEENQDAVARTRQSAVEVVKELWRRVLMQP